jgi:hypothetical protein
LYRVLFVKWANQKGKSAVDGNEKAKRTLVGDPSQGACGKRPEIGNIDSLNNNCKRYALTLAKAQSSDKGFLERIVDLVFFGF